MTPAILKSVNYKNKMYKTMVSNKNNTLLYANLKTNFNTYLKILKNTISQRKQDYFSQLFAKFKNNITKTWDVIKQSLNSFEFISGSFHSSCRGATTKKIFM